MLDKENSPASSLPVTSARLPSSAGTLQDSVFAENLLDTCPFAQ